MDMKGSIVVHKAVERGIEERGAADGGCVLGARCRPREVGRRQKGTRRLMEEEEDYDDVRTPC